MLASIGADTLVSGLSALIALMAMIVTAVLLRRQVQQMEKESNALAIIEAVNRLASHEMTRVFTQLRGIENRYPDDQAITERFFGSDDEHALMGVSQYVETIACLARRGVIDPSLIVDAVGFTVRSRWRALEPFIDRWRVYNKNEYLFENFEWLARYSNWWKDEPRPPGDRNYDPEQFGPLPPPAT